MITPFYLFGRSDFFYPSSITPSTFFIIQPHPTYSTLSPGTLKWKYETGYYVFSSPAIGADGTIYVGSWGHYLYAINPDGTLEENSYPIW